MLTGALAGAAIASSVAGAGMSAKGASQSSRYYKYAAQQALWQKPYAEMQRQAQAVQLETQSMVAMMNSQQFMAEAELYDSLGELNQLRAEGQAMLVRNRAAARAHQIRKLGHQVMGEQVVGAAKGGVTMEGTPALVLKETDRLVRQDMENILMEGDVAAQDVLFQGSLDRIGAMVAGGRSSSQAALAEIQSGSLSRAADTTRMMIPYDLRGIDMQAFGLQSQAYQSKLNGYSSLITGFGRAAGMGYQMMV